VRSSQAGFVTLAAIIIMVVVSLVGVLLYTSLLGEVQGEIGTRQSVAALGVAEAGANWAGNKLAGPNPGWYAGDTGQAVQDASGVQVGVFDVNVTCTDGSAVINGCPAQPLSRLIASTGYVPNKTVVLGKRTVQIVASTAPSTLNFNNSVCTYNALNFEQGVTIIGNIGSEGSMTPDITLLGPSGSAAQVLAGGGQPGNAYAVSTVSCSQSCPGNQIAGSVNNNQAPGSVCPNRASIVASFSCPVGVPDITSSATISVANGNTSLHNINVSSGSTITFATVGSTDVLHVNANAVTAGTGSKFVITGGGSVVLTLAGDMYIQSNSYFGVDGSNALLPAGRFEVESCSTDTGTTKTGTPSAVRFDQGTQLAGTFIVPQGSVDWDQAQVSNAVILANNGQFDKNTHFSFDGSGNNVLWASGVKTLTSWEDVP
jgi:hypothetical protein